MQAFRHAVRRVRANAARIVILGFLALPLLATLFWPSGESGEQRVLAPAPGIPANLDQVLAWPAKADAWSSDHFGWREQMVALYARARHDLFKRFPTNQMMAGRGDRIFLAAHNNRGIGAPYTALIACGWQFDDGPRIIRELNAFDTTLARQGISARLLIAPSGPVVYSDEMMPWLSERCHPDAVPLRTVLASPELTPQARARIYFPLSEVWAMRDRVTFFPKTFFHWGASGAGAVAALTEHHFWERGEDAGKPIPLVAAVRPSDVQFLFPGIRHDSLADEPDFAGTTITPCFGASCFPDLRPLMDKLAVVGHYRNSAPGLGPRLVLLSDSFGYAGAPMFARYHREVVYVSTNSLAALDPEELAQLRSLLFTPGSDDEVLFLYHDATVLFGRVGTDLDILFPKPGN
jgi:hypothetical protein